MKKIFSRLVKDESGATAIEYGLIAALLSVAIIGGATAVGSSLDGLFNGISGKLNTAGGGAGGGGDAGDAE